MLMQAMEQWLRAARVKDFDTARPHAENIVRRGSLLLENPEFIQSFRQQNPDGDPKDAFVNMCQFLVSATHGRAVVLKRFADANKSDAEES